MKLNEIRARLDATAGITELNPMQTAVAASHASRLILLSPTGSGKTVAFSLALLQRIKAGNTAPQAVIIAPSRELVQQIYNVVRPLAVGFKTMAIYGGSSFSAEAQSVAGGMPDIIVATPGRLLDHLNRGTFTLNDLRLLVLDEYDKTLELGFHDEMRRILRRCAKPAFAMVTSATRLKDMPEFFDMNNAEIIDYTETANKPAERLQIVNVPSADRDKLATLIALLREVASDGQAIVFVNHRESADRVGDALRKAHISCSVYHGGLDQQHREMALARFDSHAAQVLVATDLAGRGIDIEGVKAVVHYHPAADEQIWTHRNGRTARVDRTGEVYVISGPDEGVPEYAATDRDWWPDMTADKPVHAPFDLVYLDLGKRDKVSRGDIAGFVMKTASVPAEAVGKITLRQTYSLVAVRHGYARNVIEASREGKLKGKRVRASLA